MAGPTSKARASRAPPRPPLGKRPRPAAAKTTPPRLGPHYRSSRLYRLLDQARRRPIVWISAPAGAGKTTLVTSYLEARGLSCLWYQLDERDADPASFFSSLREAVRKRSPRKRETLQFLTPEYVFGLPAYTRNFFEKVGMRFATPFALVLDNYQDLPEHAPLQQLLPQGFASLADDFSVFVLSRNAPPAAMVGEQARRRVARVDSEALQLNEKEVQGIAKLYKLNRLSAETLADIQRRTQGWVAGVVLLLERLSVEVSRTVGVFAGEEEGVVFDYFATELFDKADRRTQALLLKTALLPQVNAELARDVTGEPRSEEILAELARKNFFTYRLAGAERVYRYHPLFQSFLRVRGNSDLAPEDFRNTRKAAAQALVRMELHDDAALVLLEGADHEGLAGLILQQAPVLIAQGRLQTLRKWLSALPPETTRAEPWLLYWLGMCALAFDPASARETLEQTYEAFRERDDARGCYSTLSGIVETLILEATDLNPLRKWIDELDHLDQAHPASSFGDLEAQIVLTAVDALLYGCPDHPRVSYWVERAETLLKGRLDPKHAVPLTAHFAFYRCCVGDFAEARGLGSDLSRLYKESAQPMVRIYCCGIRSVIAWLHGKRHEAEELVRAALEEGEAHGVHVLDARILGQACYATGNCGDAEAFERYLKQFAAIPQLGAFDKTQLTFFSSWLALLHGDYLGARREIETSVAALEKLGFPWMLAVQQAFKTQVLTATGDLQEAEQLNGMVTQFAEGMGSNILRFQTQLNDAWIALRRGNEHECRITLSQGLRFGRIRGYSIHPCAPPEMMSELCCLALEHDIEVEHVRELISAHRLTPPASAINPDAWPWPIQVYTLGRFAVLIDGHSLHFDKKAQKKPLELLKALIAFGGQNVGEQVLLEALWPEAEGDAAAQALATTVHRLRKLLGADALRRQEGRLSLDAEHCWVDIWALARALARLEEAWATGDYDGLSRGIEAVFRLYTGGFLERDPVASWMIVPRERLRAKLLRALVNAGQVLCRNGHRAQAVACYEKALEVEPLAEDVYRELMRCHLADGHPAQALSVFQRCQQIFQAELGLSPSAEIEALYEEVRNRLGLHSVPHL